MAVQVEPTHSVKRDSDQKDDTSYGEARQDGNQTGDRGRDDQGEAYTIQRTEHTSRISLLDA